MTIQTAVQAAAPLSFKSKLREIIRKRLRDTVFGLQDGLLSTMGALTGIAAGSQSKAQVILSGFVIIAVESLSMAAGSYLSSKSQKDYLERLLAEEKESIEKNPEEERSEVRAMYGSRGYSELEIEIIEKRLFSDKQLLLEDMAHKELGICPTSFEEPGGNATAMGVAYVAGGAVPLLPYGFLPFHTAMAVSILATLAALFIVGASKGRVVRQAWWRHGLEMVVVAGAAGVVGYIIGRVMGVSV